MKARERTINRAVIASEAKQPFDFTQGDIEIVNIWS
jgi:hypothetical protein